MPTKIQEQDGSLRKVEINKQSERKKTRKKTIEE